ncbi:MAG: DNA polymerase-3 subunit delta' [Urechidicola sp.]|jgi:DNA polymerase-3 subunit delta'
MADQPQNSAAFYPWQDKPREQILRQHDQDKLPHALLLVGQANLGKRAFASAIARRLLCNSPAANLPCGQCVGCGLFQAGTHPDYRVVQPEESKQIRVEQVRSLINWSLQTAQRNGYKVAIIQPAETMNITTANALLKCLEEPPGKMLFMLVTDQPMKLLPTIRSRCQRVEFPIPAPAQALGWLEGQLPGRPDLGLLLTIAGGEPLTVVRDYNEKYLHRREIIMESMAALVSGRILPADAYQRLTADKEHRPLETVQVSLGMLADSLRWHFSKDEKVIKNRDMKAHIKLLGDIAGADFLFAIQDRLLQEARHLGSTSNPDTNLLLDVLLIDISQRRLELIL